MASGRTEFGTSILSSPIRYYNTEYGQLLRGDLGERRLLIVDKFLSRFRIIVSPCRCFNHKVITIVSALDTRHIVWHVSGERVIYDSGFDPFDKKRVVQVVQCRAPYRYVNKHHRIRYPREHYKWRWPLLTVQSR